MTTKHSETQTRNPFIELGINQPAFERAVRPQLGQPSGVFGVGKMRMREGHRCLRLLVDDVEVVHELPQGASRPPLEDYCVVMVEFADTAGWSPAELIRRVQPRPSQGVAALVIHPGSKCNWDAVWQPANGKPLPIDCVRVAGPGLLKLQRIAPAAVDPVRQEQYSRVIGPLGMEGFAKLRDLTVTLVGAGRNGSLVAMQLAAMGVGHIRLVDPDLLEAPNLDSGMGRPKDVGTNKVRALGKRLLAMRPDLRVTCLSDSVLAPNVVQALRGMSTDCFITCVDFDAARVATSLLARETITPHLDIGTLIRRDENGELQMSGDARLLLPGQGCCLCVGGVANEEQTLYELSAPPDVMTRGEPTSWAQQRTGSLISLNSIACGAGVQMILDLLGGELRTSQWQRFAWKAGEGIQSDAAAVTAGIECPICQAAGAR